MILEVEETQEQVNREIPGESQEKKEMSQEEKDRYVCQATNQLIELAEENFLRERKIKKFSRCCRTGFVIPS